MKLRSYLSVWIALLLLCATVPVLAQGQTPTTPRSNAPGPRNSGIGSGIGSSYDQGSGLSSDNGLGKRKSLKDKSKEDSGVGERKSLLEKAAEEKKDAKADEGDKKDDSSKRTEDTSKGGSSAGGAGPTVIGGGGGGSTSGGGSKGSSAGGSTPGGTSSGGGNTGMTKGEAATISVVGEGSFEPVLQRKLEWGEVPDEGEAITLEGPSPLTEFLAAINIATNWNIITSDKAKEVELPYFNLVEVSPKQALEILKFLDVYYDFKEMENESKFLYVMTKDEFNTRSFGDAKPEEFRVAHADVAYIESALKPLLSKAGRMLSDQRGGIIYVWDTGDNVDQIRKTFTDLDVPMEKREFSIQYSDVADIETVLRELISENANLLTDARTGTIIVWDTPQKLTQVAEAVERLDVPLDSKTFEIAHANAEDLTDSLEVMLTERGIIQVDPRTNSLIVTDIPARVKKIGEFVATIDRDLDTRTWVIKYGDIDFIADQIESYIPSDMGDVVVNDTVHQITVTGLPTRLDKIDELIKTWDIKRRQVLIEAYIVEANNEVERQFNVNWSYFGSSGNSPIFFNGGDGFKADSDANLRVGQLPYSVPLYGGLQLDESGKITRPIVKNIDGKTVTDFIAGNKIAATLDYLDKQDKATILSSPRVVVQDGEEATFENATQVPFVSASTIYGGYGNTNVNNPNNPNNNFNNYSPNNTNRIEFIDVGTILSVLPYISEDNNILLDVEAEDSTFILRTILSNGSPSTVPEKTVRRAATQLRVASGETVVLGGLRKDRAEKNVSKTPVLGDLPLIGRLFRYPNNKSNNNSLLLFLTTTIVDEHTHPEAIQLASAEERIAEAGRHNNKDFWGRLKDDVATGKQEIFVTIGQNGNILSDGEILALEDLKTNLFDLAEKNSKLTVILRSHPRAPSDVVTAVTEAVMEANLKVEFSDTGVPLVPNLEPGAKHDEAPITGNAKTPRKSRHKKAATETATPAVAIEAPKPIEATPASS